MFYYPNVRVINNNSRVLLNNMYFLPISTTAQHNTRHTDSDSALSIRIRSPLQTSQPSLSLIIITHITLSQNFVNNDDTEDSTPSRSIYISSTLRRPPIFTTCCVRICWNSSDNYKSVFIIISIANDFPEYSVVSPD